MITQNDFIKKQVIFVMADSGERVSVSNENLVVKDDSGKIKLQCSCYKLFIVFIIGHCSLTTNLLKHANKFGFFIALMTSGFHMYSLIGIGKDGNTLLKKKQYAYKDIGIAKIITANKIANQRYVLNKVRNKSESVREAIAYLKTYEKSAETAENLNELMAYEGLASKIYFRNHFDNILWKGRQPRVKRDYVNSVLDIGYTLLFSFVDAIVSSYGFDTYCGVMHRQFYMRKSLICDIVEPFRFIIDMAVKKGINLKQISENDFDIINGQYKLQWKHNKNYIKLLMTALLEYKEEIFVYIQKYYRAFMKGIPDNEFPVFIPEV